MMYEAMTTLPPPEVLSRAQRFFTERMPQYGAFLEKLGPSFATFRGQGGEELTLAVFTVADGTRIRASTMFFDQAIGRFLSTLPPALQGGAA